VGEKWKLFNVTNDPGENNDVSDQHPDIVQKMVAAYEKYSKDVGVIPPRGAAFEKSVASLFPPINNKTK